MTFHRIRLGLVGLAVILVAPFMLAQQQTLGSLNGTVLDASGASVPGATVTAVNDQTTLTRVGQDLRLGILANPRSSHWHLRCHRRKRRIRDGKRAPSAGAGIPDHNHQHLSQARQRRAIGDRERQPHAERHRHDQRLHARQGADRRHAAGHGQFHAARDSGARRHLAIHRRRGNQPGPRQPEHLGQRPARHLEHHDREWRGRNQSLQRQTASEQASQRYQFNIGEMSAPPARRDAGQCRRLRLQWQRSGFSPARVPAGSERHHLDVRRAAGPDQRRAHRRDHQQRLQCLARPDLWPCAAPTGSTPTRSSTSRMCCWARFRRNT